MQVFDSQERRNKVKWYQNFSRPNKKNYLLPKRVMLASPLFREPGRKACFGKPYLLV